MARVLCVGTVVYDQVFWVDEIPSQPVKVLANRHRSTGGGMAATAAVAIAALGGEAAYWGRVGDDDAGTAVMGWMAEAGVDIASVRRIPGGRTAISGLIVDPRGERLLAAYPGSNLGGDISWLPLASVARAGAVLCDIRWKEGVTAAFQAARRSGVPTILDADLATRDDLQALIGLSDHVIFSERCLLHYSGGSDRHAALLSVAEETGAHLGVTLGSLGAEFLLDDRIERLPAFPVAVRETNGAGDVFHGAYALAIAEGRDVREAAVFANAAAAMKCSLEGGWSGMPGRGSVEEIVRKMEAATVLTGPFQGL